LGKTDSPDLADLLEVYQLCLLLGFAGRYSLGGSGELRAVCEAVAEKIRRIRGAAGEISPAWALPPEAVRRAGTDPLVQTFGIAAAACGLLAVILFMGLQADSGLRHLQPRGLGGKVMKAAPPNCRQPLPNGRGSESTSEPRPLEAVNKWQAKACPTLVGHALACPLPACGAISSQLPRERPAYGHS